MSYKQLLEQILKRYESMTNSRIILEINKAEKYPTDKAITYTLFIKRNRDLIYKNSFVQDNLFNYDGEQELCLITIEDLMHYGLDKIEKDWDNRKLKMLPIEPLQAQLNKLEEKLNKFINEQ